MNESQEIKLTKLFIKHSKVKDGVLLIDMKPKRVRLEMGGKKVSAIDPKMRTDFTMLLEDIQNHYSKKP
jgi:hypothetical protein